MRDNIRAFVEAAAGAFELDGPVYEFGSFQVPGQQQIADMRTLFPGQPYVGCDIRPGLGVDRLEDLADLSLADESARTIICVETLEHVFDVGRAASELIRVLAPGGTLLLSTPFDFSIHGYPSDYWRLTPVCLQRLFAPLDAVLVGWQGPEKHPHTVFAVACKAPLTAHYVERAKRFAAAYTAWCRDAARREAWPRRLKRRIWTCLGTRSERRRWREYHQVKIGLDAISMDSSQPVGGGRPAEHTAAQTPDGHDQRLATQLIP
ncbi:MAG TPA: methyltransferase domain-containing protein [Pirellulales bacterium]|nr:methyltransferase domain-containing protein [Pirellulales bacterium]